jgi:DNA-binding NtrC family response regulator
VVGRPQRRAPNSPSADALRILVVDDDTAQLEIIQRILADHGCRVTVASRVAPAIALLEQRPYDVLITDLRMPDADGIDLARYVRENHPDTGVIVVTGYPSSATAFETAKLGALAYLEKPFTPQDLTTTVDTCAATAAARRRADPGTRQAGNADGIRWGFVGESPEMLRVYSMISKVAPSDLGVLLQGESGTGKELGARAIHEESPRSAAPFVAVNCAGMSRDLIESLLFGHVLGAFTGANRDHEGYFAQADGGTLFLDEISDMPIELQPQLLRTLETGRIRPVGAKREKQVDVRVITATNTNLAEAVERSEFRGDLFHRINVLRIDLPPLRDRGDDIILLKRHFLDHYARKEGRPPPLFTDPAVELLRRHNWPGNVRELKNLAARLVLICDGETIDVGDLQEAMRSDLAAQSLLHRRDSREIPRADRPLGEVIHWHCERALQHFNGNKTRAARSLRIARKRLRAILDDEDTQDEDADA